MVQEAWKPVFWAEVLTVVKALRAEKDLQGRNFSLNDWMQLRILTISGMSSTIHNNTPRQSPPTLTSSQPGPS